MHIVLGVLTLVAAAMTTAAAVMGGSHGAASAGSGAGLKLAALNVDLTSFAFGFMAGMAALWLSRIEWAAIPQALVATFQTWRRNVLFLSLAAASAGILLFY